MRLRLDDIDEGSEIPQPDGMYQVVPMAAMPPVKLVLSPLVPAAMQSQLPVAQVIGSARLPALAGRGCPPDCRLHVVSEEIGETALGWPLRLVHVEVRPDGKVDAAGVDAGRVGVIEERIVAVYQFLRYAAVALVQGASLAHHRLRLAELLRSGRPDWQDADSGTVTALWDIWQ